MKGKENEDTSIDWKQFSVTEKKYPALHIHTPQTKSEKMVKSEPVLCIQPGEEPGSKKAKRSDNMNIEIMNQVETTHQHYFVYFMKWLFSSPEHNRTRCNSQKTIQKHFS